MKNYLSLAAITLMAVFSLPATAEVEVVDSKPIPKDSVATRQGGYRTAGTVRQAPQNEAAQVYYQLQLLQQEVRELRGIVEEQAHKIKELNRKRTEDYIDLDRRLGLLSQQKPQQPAANASTLNSSVNNAAASITQTLETKARPGPVEELKMYRSAIDLAIKEKKFDQAITSLNQYLVEYPQGHYAANAKYWLGQIYMQKDDLDQSAAWFTRVTNSHPHHQKTPEAKFKLGKVYHLKGEADRAKALLNEVASSNSAAASLAQAYLQENF